MQGHQSRAGQIRALRLQLAALVAMLQFAMAPAFIAGSSEAPETP